MNPVSKLLLMQSASNYDFDDVPSDVLMQQQNNGDNDVKTNNQKAKQAKMKAKLINGNTDRSLSRQSNLTQHDG